MRRRRRRVTESAAAGKAGTPMSPAGGSMSEYEPSATAEGASTTGRDGAGGEASRRDDRADIVMRTTWELVRFVRETRSPRESLTDRIACGLWWACGVVLVGSAIAAWFYR